MAAVAAIILVILILLGIITATEMIDRRRTKPHALPMKPDELIVIAEETITRRRTFTVKRAPR